MKCGSLNMLTLDNKNVNKNNKQVNKNKQGEDEEKGSVKITEKQTYSIKGSER